MNDRLETPITKPLHIVSNVKPGAMGNFGRITTLKEAPPAVAMKKYIKKAMKIVDIGIAKKAAKKPKKKKKKTF